MTRYTGYLCRRDIHEFLFAETPVDEAAPPGSSAAAAQRLGCVAVTVFATRRVRVDDSSSDDEQGHSSSGAITATRLPEKQAVKEFGVQARAGGPVERVPRYRRRRRGEWRLEKVKPAVATVSVCYRDEMWWSRNGLLDADAPPKPRRDRTVSAASNATAGEGGQVRVKAEGEGGATAAAVVAPSVKMERRAGEAPRAPDGKRRKLAVASEADEVIVLSD